MIEQSVARLPTEFGTFQMHAFANDAEDAMPHLALVAGDVQAGLPTLVRIHSECLTGDLFHSLRCDCGPQLRASLAKISEEGGVLVYLRQEGRGIGLSAKLHAYNLQDQGKDTIEANLALGFEADNRSYEDAVTILNLLGVTQVRLLTNNPSKARALEDSTIVLTERVPLLIETNKESESYFQTKKTGFGHWL
jgi:GTP cyclohydrolase II